MTFVIVQAFDMLPQFPLALTQAKDDPLRGVGFA